MKNTYMKPAYAHILLDARLSSQCKKDENNQFVVHYSWQVCPIDTGVADEFGDGQKKFIFGDNDIACTATWQDAEASMNICYLNAGPSSVVFGS